MVLDGQDIGFAEYVQKGGRYLFVHTEIDPEFGGRGLGTILAHGAMDAMRAEQARIVPLCPFIARWIADHPDYADLVDHELMARIEARS
jgi:predicted GNAT family acetyltransferase